MRLLPQPGLSSFLSLLSLSLLLAACGSGGGGGGGATTAPQAGSDSAGSFRVALSPTSYGAQWEQGLPLPPLEVKGTGIGALPASVFLGAKDQGSAIDHVTVEGTGASAKFTVYVKSNLPLGQHKGTLQFSACRDEACTVHFAGSPASMPYDITIIKALRIAPTALRLSALSGATPGADIVVELPAGQTDYRVTPTVPWLTVSKQTQAGFTLTAKPMAPGRYQGSVTVYAAGRDTPVAVDYEVTGDATTVTSIVPDQASLSLATLAAGSATGVLNLTLPPWTDELNASVQGPAWQSDWLSVSKSGPRSLAVTASASTLPAGTYQAMIVLSSGPGIPTTNVPVAFTVGPAHWTIQGNTAFTVRSDTTAAQLSSTLVLAMPGLPPQAYSASTTAPWLKLSRSAGSPDSTPLRVDVVPAEMLKLLNFPSHTAEIVITPAARNLPPLNVTVTLDKSLPQLNYVSPHTRLPNEGGIYTLRGRNFDSIADLAGVLQTSGGAPTQVTRVNDTTLRVRMPGAASGDVSFSLKNALGLPAGAPVLSVVPQGALPYAAIPARGQKTGLVFDAQRQTLYTVDRTQQAILRFQWKGGSWEQTATPLANPDGVALSPDGKILVASTIEGNIVLFDPATMAQQARDHVSWPSLTLGHVPGTQLLAVTNDGRAWYSTYAWRGLTYFDLVTRERGLIAGDRVVGSGDGPWFSMSGDGSRLNIALDRFGEPTNYLDDSDGTLRVSPTGYGYWGIGVQSLHGERFVEGLGRVWDRDFNPVGNLVIPENTSYYAAGYTISPDGARTYALAYYAFSNGPRTPRVYVFDTSTPAPDGKLPVLGYFEVPDATSCRGTTYDCTGYAIGAISPDGKTLFFVGDEKLVVTPIPALKPVPAAASGAAGQALKMTRLPGAR